MDAYVPPHSLALTARAIRLLRLGYEVVFLV